MTGTNQGDQLLQTSKHNKNTLIREPTWERERKKLILPLLSTYPNKILK